MKIQHVCLYCGNEWELSLIASALSRKCLRCGDTNIKTIKPGKRVDYYADDNESSAEPRESDHDYQD